MVFCGKFYHFLRHPQNTLPSKFQVFLYKKTLITLHFWACLAASRGKDSVECCFRNGSLWSVHSTSNQQNGHIAQNISLLGTNISPTKALLKMVFLFPGRICYVSSLKGRLWPKKCWLCSGQNYTSVDRKQFFSKFRLKHVIWSNTCWKVWMIFFSSAHFFFRIAHQGSQREPRPLQSSRRRPHQPTPRRPGLRLH